MGFIIYDSTGGSIPPNGIVTRVSETYTSRVVVHDLPGTNKDIIQSLKLKNKRFSIKGVVFSKDGADFCRGAVGYTGSITGSDDRGYTTLPQTQIFYISVRFTDRAGKPFEKEFTFEGIEVK